MPSSEEPFEAIKAKDVQTFQRLLSEGVAPDSQDGDGGDYAIAKAAARKQAEMVRLLLEAGASVDARREGGRTALHFAAWHWNSEIVEALIAAGADVNATDDSRWTPIFLTSTWDGFETLLKHGARVDIVATDGETLIRRMALATAGSAPADGVKILTKLVELGLAVEDEPLDRHGCSLLMDVIDRGTGRQRNDVAHFLLDAGMDPLLCLPQGVTVLHYACKKSDLDMVETLLALGADPNARVTEEWFAYDEGARPLDMTENYVSSYKAIKAALTAAGLARSNAPIANAVVGNRIVIEIDADDVGESLNDLLTITKDIKTNVYRHPDYDGADERLQFRFDVGDQQDVLDEQQYFAVCVESGVLSEEVEQYVRQIIAFNNTRGGEPVYTHSEQEAGGLAMEALLTTGDAAYLPLFLEYLKSIDLDHTVHLYELLDTVRDVYSEEQLEELVAWLDEQGFEG